MLRFTDDTYDRIGKGSSSADRFPSQALDLARKLEPRLLKETGANISARLAVSLANKESPGFFLAQFDRGKLGRFTFMIDPQCRILNYIFQFDAGENATIFHYSHSPNYVNESWMTTRVGRDYANKLVDYSSDFDVVDPKHYRMEIDIREGGLRTKVRIDFRSLVDNLRAIPMIINNSITAAENKRLKESMRVESARYDGRHS